MMELVANCDRFKILKHSTTTPYAFTEFGVSMLPSVLSSQKAIDTRITQGRFFCNNERTVPVLYHCVIAFDTISKAFALMSGY